MNHDALFFGALLHGQGSPADLKRIAADQLDETWAKVYTFCLDHVRANGKLPHAETVEMQCGVMVGPAPEGLDFYARCIRDNAMRIAMEDGFVKQVVSPLGENKAHEALHGAKAVISDVTRQFSEIGSGATLDYGSNVGVRFADYEMRAQSGGVLGLPTPWQSLTTMTGGFLPGELWVLLARPNLGKAQPLDARVLTTHGWKAMGDIRVGDALASIDGRPSEVAAIHPQGVRQVYRVAFSDGRSTEVCGEHLWRVHHRGWARPRVLDTDTVRTMLAKKRYQKRLWVDRFQGEFDEGGDLPLDPWVLGALLGDGGLTKDSSVSFTNSDDWVVGKMRGLLPEGVVLTGGKDGQYYISAPDQPNNPVLDALRALGLQGSKSINKFIPPVYLHASRQVREQLLSGLMDTDGDVGRTGSLVYGSSSLELMENVVYLVRSLGGVARVGKPKRPTYTHNGEKREGELAYRATLRLDRPWDCVTLPRRRGRIAVDGRKTPRLTFASIEPTRMTEVQCITVTHPSHLYVTDEFTVTHNSWALILIAITLYQAGYRVLFCSMETPAQGRLPKNQRHRVVRGTCVRCFLQGVTAQDPCPAAQINRQRLSIRFDSIGSQLSAWRMLQGNLTPREKERYQQYLRVVQNPQAAGYDWGALRIVAPPDVRSLVELEVEILSFQPDIVLWDSAYLAAKAKGKQSRKDACDEMIGSFSDLLMRESISGAMSWHLKREVTEKATHAGLGDTSYTDELGRLVEVALGLFRPPEMQEAHEAILRTLKVRDGVRMPELRTKWMLKQRIDFTEIEATDTEADKGAA